MNADIDSVRQLLSRPINFHRALVPLAGSVAGAVWLGQMIYWSDKCKDKNGWIYKTQEEWKEETCVGRYGQEQARKSLKSTRILEERLRGIPGRLYYRINFENLLEQLSNPVGNQNVETSKQDCENQQPSKLDSAPYTESTIRNFNTAIQKQRGAKLPVIAALNHATYTQDPSSQSQSQKRQQRDAADDLVRSDEAGAHTIASSMLAPVEDGPTLLEGWSSVLESFVSANSDFSKALKIIEDDLARWLEVNSANQYWAKRQLNMLREWFEIGGDLGIALQECCGYRSFDSLMRPRHPDGINRLQNMRLAVKVVNRK